MLLTSAQVSIAISSSIVFSFTTVLFLCGYVLQQQTLRNLREAIKPQPRPTHTSFYLPSQSQPAPAPGTDEGDALQVIEIFVESADTSGGNELLREDAAAGQVAERESKSQQTLGNNYELEGIAPDENVQKAEVANQKDRQRGGQETLELEAEPYAESPTEGISNPRKSKSRGEAQPPKRLSMAARRRAIKEEIQRLSGQDVLDNPRAYKRRLW